MRFFILSLSMIMFFVNPAMAQDERFWRKLVTGELTREQKKEPGVAKWVFSTPRYEFDLNSDGKNESLTVQLVDGMSVVEIYSHDKSLLFRGTLTGVGMDSKIYRLRLIDVSDKVRSLLIHFYEGKTESQRFEATARLYFVTFAKADMSKFSFQKGPQYWHEFEAPRDQYWRRKYAINVMDLNKDGAKEVFVNFNSSQSVWQYQNSGLWQKL
jgi:hypothetical protein